MTTFLSGGVRRAEMGRHATAMAAVSEGDRMEQSLHVVHITRKNANEVGRSIPLEEISSPLVLTAVKLWEEQRGNRKFPSRNDLSPRALSAYLRNIMLYRLIGTGEDFEVRVMGDAAVYAYGTCYQGMRMSEVNRIRPGMGDVVARVCSSVLNRKAPLAFKGRLSAGECAIINQEIVFLPVGPVDTLVDHILSIGDYSPRMLLGGDAN